MFRNVWMSELQLKWLYIKQKTESEPKVKEMRIDCDFLVYLQID
jgi:hypothetical protein